MGQFFSCKKRYKKTANYELRENPIENTFYSLKIYMTNNNSSLNYKILIGNGIVLETIKDEIKWIYMSKNRYEKRNRYDINLLNNINKIEIYMNANSSYSLLALLQFHYDKIQEYFYSKYGKELIEWIYHPKNMNKWSKDCWDLDIY